MGKKGGPGAAAAATVAPPVQITPLWHLVVGVLLGVAGTLAVMTMLGGGGTGGAGSAVPPAPATVEMDHVPLPAEPVAADTETDTNATVPIATTPASAPVATAAATNAAAAEAAAASATVTAATARKRPATDEAPEHADGDGETVGKAATKGAEGATGAATTGNAAPAALDGDAAVQPAQPAMTVTFETGVGTEGGDASTEDKSKKKKKKKKNPNPAATLLTWASKYKSKEVLPTVIEAFANLPDAPVFGGLNSVALIEGKSGKRIKSAKQAGSVAKAAIKALTELAKLDQGVQPQLESFLWKKMAHELDEMDGDPGTRNFFARCIKVSGALERINDSVMRGGWTHFMMAIRAGDMDVATALVLGGVDINMANDDGNRPLHIALDRWSELQIKQHRAECRPGFEMNLQLLLEQPELDTRGLDPAGNNLLWCAVNARHLDTVTRLLERDPGLVEQSDKDRQPVLHRAIDPSVNIITGAKWLIGHGNHFVAQEQLECEHNSVQSYGFNETSVMHTREFSMRHDHVALAAEVHAWTAGFVSVLLAAGSDVTTADAQGRTALHIAAVHGNTPAVELLLAAGADRAVRDRNGKNPAGMAADATYIGVAQLLADGTDQTPEDPEFETTMVSRVDGALVDWGEPRETPLLPDESATEFRCDIDVREGLTALEFRQQYWLKRRPVLIRGGLKGRRTAIARWGKAELLALIGQNTLQIARVQSSEQTKSSEKTLGAFLKYIKATDLKLNQTFQESSPSTDMIIEARWDQYPEFHKAVIALMQAPSASGWLEQAAGSDGLHLNNYQVNVGVPFSGTSLHFHFATMSTLLHGRKRWFLFRPRDAFYSRAHFFDDFEAVRKGEHGPALECMQQATDVLFLPSLWGHGVLYEEVSVSASFLYG